jgi:hypothetical protein
VTPAAATRSHVASTAAWARGDSQPPLDVESSESNESETTEHKPSGAAAMRQEVAAVLSKGQPSKAAASEQRVAVAWRRTRGIKAQQRRAAAQQSFAS